MSSANPFGLLEDDEVGDVNHLVEVQRKKLEAAAAESAAAEAAAKKSQSQAAPLPSKPLPPNQAVKEARSEYGRGGGRGGDRGGRGGRGGRGFNRESDNNENSYGNNNGYPGGGYRQSDERDSGRAATERRGGYGGGGGGRGPYRGGAGGGGGGRRGGFSNGEAEEGGERPRRTYERRSGTGRGSEIKREGSGRGNWGTTADDITPEVEEPVVEAEKAVDAEKPAGEGEAVEASKEEPVAEPEKEQEDKEMTLGEYEKVLEEKRKVLESLKTSDVRKVDSKEFESMKQISCKKENNEIFAQLGSEKDKRKEAAQKEEKAKKSVSINEFLKPAGDKNYSPGGRGRGRGRGARGGGFGGGYASSHAVAAPSIEDPGQFPTLGGK